MTTQLDLLIEQGKTYQAIARWEVDPLVFKPIAAIAQTAPARITCAGHGMPDGWRAAIVDVVGMTELNAKKNPPAVSDFRRMTVVDANTVTVDEISSAAFKPYRSGGFLAYFSAPDLTGFTARMSIKDKVGGTLLHSLTTENGGIVVDADGDTISLEISATDTAALAACAKGVYDLEMVSPEGAVTAILKGNVYVTPEVTT